MSKTPTLAVLASLTLLLGAAGPTDSPAPPERGYLAADILARSAVAYAAPQSYADSGTLTQEHATTTRSKFRTRFVRPARNFFLEFQALHNEARNGGRLDLSMYHYVFWMCSGCCTGICSRMARTNRATRCFRPTAAAR
ncbi:MAG: hypothetical protein ABIQ49_15625 [Gemmatimonadales bacterium]